jgi:nucleoside-diphosphate-sugar epimerase
MTNNGMILVTGASGFIGGWIAETLCLSQATNVRASIRSWSGAARLARFPIEIVLCDVMDKQSIARAMSGASCVIHCVSGSSETIIQGTGNVLEVAHAQKIGRFVHLSTTEVYGNVHGEIDETFPLKSMGNPYSDAKIEAEKLCWQYYKRGLPVTVIRPSIVYGPFSKVWTVLFAQRFQSKNWGIFQGYGEGICNLVYVADLVSGILLAAYHKRAVGEAFNLVGPELMTWNKYFEKFNAALGLSELRVIAPANARLRASALEPIRSLGKVVLKHYSAPLRKISQGIRQARRLMQYVDKKLKTNPRTFELSLYNREALYLTTKARNMLGYQPNFGVDRGLDLSVQWLRNVGLV